ncbi:hypothetical protein [Aureivirga marina]|uniref:hypothetical protein n=1 Tax=Aureivirga marina TaxID=1182451 RepID=UPI0018CA27B9|nr:hypothetical protein [Aureivirga marina]
MKIELEKTIIEVSSKFEKTNNAFVINILKDHVEELQIFHGGLIEQISPESQDFNFSFNLAFDNEKERLEKFKSLKIAEEFTFYEWDGIPFYALNVGNNPERTTEIAIIILSEVYEFDLHENFEFETIDLGQIQPTPYSPF